MYGRCTQQQPVVTFTGTQDMNCATGARCSIIFGPGHGGNCCGWWYHVFDFLMYDLFLDAIKDHSLLQIAELLKVKSQVHMLLCNYFQLPETSQ